MKAILEINNISKKFRINSETASYLSLRDSISSAFKKPSSKKEDFYALENISFDVLPGETIGVIGRNGAGKSTLLKILSRITPPTSGNIISRGRMASLLEVGTGFHPELSGKENIFFNGSILGMKRKEIIKNLDAIVDFAGVGKFIDTPLKHYSSGMQLRLAFAVAAFLENEILVIDEVLAVGDAEFQKKCIGKMEDISHSGRTILFVSHNMGSVINLCKSAILLDKGRLLMKDKSELTANRYLSSNFNSEQGNTYNGDGVKNGNKPFYFEKVYTSKVNGELAEDFGFNESICLHFKMKAQQKASGLVISVALLDKFGNRVVTQLKELNESNFNTNNSGISLRFPSHFFAPNFYSFHFAICKTDWTNIYDIHEEKCRIRIIDTGTSFSSYEGKDYGNIILDCEWINN